MVVLAALVVSPLAITLVKNRAARPFRLNPSVRSATALSTLSALFMSMALLGWTAIERICAVHPIDIVRLNPPPPPPLTETILRYISDGMWWITPAIYGVLATVVAIHWARKPQEKKSKIVLAVTAISYVALLVVAMLGINLWIGRCQ